MLQEQLSRVTDAYMETTSVPADHMQELENHLDAISAILATVNTQSRSRSSIGAHYDACSKELQCKIEDVASGLSLLSKSATDPKRSTSCFSFTPEPLEDSNKNPNFLLA